MPLPANVLGLLLGGPTLMVWGTDEQKERYLRPILSAEEIWCQGFSEPDAGSDLASLKTRAVKDGDEWVVTGQKVWTSGAQYSKWCMLVARTDGDVPKHKGLTYFLMDMEQDAVQVRPLRQITGEAEFNELFIEEARIPDENVVGGVGNGWKVALTTLMNERAGPRLRAADPPAPAARRRDRGRRAERGLLEDPLYADELAELHVRCESIRLLAWKGLTDVERYGQPGPEGSLVKWLWSDTNQRLTQLAADVVGAEALTVGDELELRAAARARQHDRGRHDGGAEEHRRRARARPPAPEGRSRSGMDFGFTDDQREIQRTARDLLAERATPERVREHAEARTTDDGAVARAVRARLAGDRGLRGVRRPGPRADRAVDPLRGARPRARAGAVPTERDGGGGDRARRLARAARALAAGARVAARRSARSARRSTAPRSS